MDGLVQNRVQSRRMTSGSATKDADVTAAIRHWPGPAHLSMSGASCRL